MGDKTTIQWTDATWNPVRGCSRVSEGCRNCYAEGVAARFSGPGQPYEGLARWRGKKSGALLSTEPGGMDANVPASARESRWTGEVRMVPEHLADPLRWRRPRRVFVNSMSDLFHEKLTNEQIAAVFGVMAAAPQHTFQVLTKRAKRMRAWFEWIWGTGLKDPRERCAGHAMALLEVKKESDVVALAGMPKFNGQRFPWPLPNVWLGVSVENQEMADRRISRLLATPAEVRFISAEPLLGPLSLDRVFGLQPGNDWADCLCDEIDPRDKPCIVCDGRKALGADSGLHWVIVGGESGPRARPFDLGWARSIVGQCKAAGVPVFVKQLGARPVDRLDRPIKVTIPFESDGLSAVTGGGALTHGPVKLRDSHGGDPAEWPEDLRVREFPKGESVG